MSIRKLNFTDLNESPRPKAGKYFSSAMMMRCFCYLNESPRPKAGKFLEGNFETVSSKDLNESPRPKAGKSSTRASP